MDKDPGFLAELETTVNSWISLIYNVTSSIESAPARSVKHEIVFWRSTSEALGKLEDQLGGEHVALSLAALGASRKFRYIIALYTDANIEHYKRVTRRCYSFMRGIKLNDVLSAGSVPDLRRVASNMFRFVEARFDPSIYPYLQVPVLCEHLCNVVSQVLCDILPSMRLLTLDYASFRETFNECLSVFDAVDISMVKIKTLCNFKNFPYTSTSSQSSSPYVKFRERLKTVKEFRDRHEKFISIIEDLGHDKNHMEVEQTNMSVPNCDKRSLLECMHKAYEDLYTSTRISDISSEGCEEWSSALYKYSKKVSFIEDIISLRIANLLNSSCSESAIFNVISKFSSILQRPKIHSVVKKYQNELLEKLKADLKDIKCSLDQPFLKTEVCLVYRLKGVSAYAARLLYIKHIDSRLKFISDHVKLIFGEHFYDTSKGHEIRDEIASISSIAKIEDLSSWVGSILSNSAVINETMFNIRRKRDSKGREYFYLCLNVNMEFMSHCRDYSIITSYMSVVPHKTEKILENLVHMSHFIPMLEGTVRSYANIFNTIFNNELAHAMLKYPISEIQTKALDVSDITWKDILEVDYPVFVRSDLQSGKLSNLKAFINLILKIEDKLNRVIDTQKEVERLIDSLKACDLRKMAVLQIIDSIQNKVTPLFTVNLEHTNAYADKVNRKIAEILNAKFNDHIKLWNNLLLNPENFSNKDFLTYSHEFLGAPFYHVVIGNVSIPCLSAEKTLIISKISSWIDDIASLPFIAPNTYESEPVQAEYALERAYMLSRNIGGLSSILHNIVRIYNNARRYYSYWYKKSSLLRSNFLGMMDKKGKENLKLCGDMLKIVAKSRKNIDIMPDTHGVFPWIIDARKIKKEINKKYSSLQSEAEKAFYAILMDKSEFLISDVNEKLKILRDIKIDFYDIRSSTEIVELIRKMKLEALMVDEKTCELVNYLLLLRGIRSGCVQGFEVDILRSAISTLSEQLCEKESYIMGKSDIINSNTMVMYEDIQKTIGGIEESLREIKLLYDRAELEHVLDTLHSMLFELEKIELECNVLQRASCIFSTKALNFERLYIIKENISSLHEAYISLREPYSGIKDILNTIWSQKACTQSIAKLELLSVCISQVSTFTKHTKIYEKICNDINFYIKKIPVLKLLGSDIMKDRHIARLVSRLDILDHTEFHKLTLKDFLGSNVSLNDPVLKDILNIAREERAIESSIAGQEDAFRNSKLELSEKDQVVMTIKNIDSLLYTLSESLSTSSKLKSSPYFDQFSDRILSIEEKLSAAVRLFDTWDEVQHQLVYLTNVLVGNIELEQVLPSEVGTLKAAVYNYHALLGSIRDFPSYSGSVSNAREILRSILDSLKGVRRALYSYIKSERNEFYRFYLLGVEELLEMVGGGVKSLYGQRYLHKMFAGISSLVLDESEDRIVGLKSKEGEVLYLENPISTNGSSRVKNVLKALEIEMKRSVALYISRSYERLEPHSIYDVDLDFILEWIKSHPSQATSLAYKVLFTEAVEAALKKSGGSGCCLLKNINRWNEQFIDRLVLEMQSSSSLLRRNYQNLVLEAMRQLNIVSTLISKRVSGISSFTWTSQVRVYYNGCDPCLWNRVVVKVSTFSFVYGYEYHGVPECLVYTLLIHSTIIAMCSSISNGYGGCLYGPSGTGKTEVVNFLGNLLGRYVVHFCCDNRFNFKLMGSILIGLCKIGAWGCFDEFNRLEQGTMSSISQLIHNIQVGLKNNDNVTLLDNNLFVNANTGIFITMNPNYLGRSVLPANLTSLFRRMLVKNLNALEVARAILCKEGFENIKDLASKLVTTINICEKRLPSSSEDYYDFSLRMLKNVLTYAGNLKYRQAVSHEPDTHQRSSEVIIAGSLSTLISPRFCGVDKLIYECALNFVFGDNISGKFPDTKSKALRKRAMDTGHVETTIEAILHLHNIIDIMSGAIITGPPHSGKTHTYRALFNICESLSNKKGRMYVINPKVMNKEYLFGKLSSAGEWTDGLFTRIIRKITDRGKTVSDYFHWIVFDGDIDPDWAENLNSVLDESRMLTAYNGERFTLDDSIKIIFETDSLRNTTLATVSRCGLVKLESSCEVAELYAIKKFSDLFKPYIDAFSHIRNYDSSAKLATEFLMSYLCDDITGIIFKAVEIYKNHCHVVYPSFTRAINTMLSLTRASLDKMKYHYEKRDSLSFSTASCDVRDFLIKESIFNLIWSFSSDMIPSHRASFTETLLKHIRATDIKLPQDFNTVKYFIDISKPGFISLLTPPTRIKTDATCGFEDIGTYTNGAIILSLYPACERLLASLILYTPIITLIGRAGIGKSTALFSAFSKIPKISVLELNFSSLTISDTIVEALEYACDYKQMATDAMLIPKSADGYLVVICRNISLPKPDEYNSRTSLCFLQHVVDHKKFWHNKRKQWIEIDRIHFAATLDYLDCSADIVPKRLIGKGCVISIDPPDAEFLLGECIKNCNISLNHLKCTRIYVNAIASSMIEVQSCLKSKFCDKHFYFSGYCSLQLLFSWISSISTNTKNMEYINMSSFTNIWMHEALRVLGDRLADYNDKLWIKEYLISVAIRYFGEFVDRKILEAPLYFSTWNSRFYSKIDSIETIREFIKDKLSTTGKKHLKHIVLPGEFIEHMLRINRVLDLPGGHLVLIGPRGSGKTFMLKATALIGSINIIQPMPHKGYNNDDLENDIRSVLLSTVVRDEKTCLIIKESDIAAEGLIDFANDVILGVRSDFIHYKGYLHLLKLYEDSIKNYPKRADLSLDWASARIRKNLHIIIVQSIPSDNNTIPLAFYGKCTVNYVSEWHASSLREISKDYIANLCPDHQDDICEAFLRLNHILRCKFKNKYTDVPVWHHLNFISHFASIYKNKISELESNKRHLATGLSKINTAYYDVSKLKTKLSEKESCLNEKDVQAKEKLEQMLGNQCEAEKKRLVSIENRRQYQEKKQKVEERRKVVLKELSDIQPLLEDAKASVGNIGKHQLAEVRTMTNPPIAVKVAVESVCILLGHKIDSWKDVQAVLKRDDFITNILNHKADDIEPQVQRELANLIECNADINVEVVNRASKACGPLYSWALAQLKYSCIIAHVKPLKLEVHTLERELEAIETLARNLSNTIEVLEQSINSYQREYSLLMDEIRTLRCEMSHVRKQVNRNVNILKSLASEKERWEAGVRSYQERLKLILGDSFLAAACLALFGPLEQSQRASLFKEISSYLSELNIAHTKSLSIADYLSTLPERMEWGTFLNSSDAFYIENIIMVLKSSRYPLILDPSGQISNFMLKFYGDRGISVSSFHEKNFLRTVKECLKLGIPLLLKNAEYYDNILDNLVKMNFDYNNEEGYTVCVGLDKVEVSSNFFLFLISDETLSGVSPSLLNHTNIINFAATDESVQSSCLDTILKYEKSDLEKRKNESIRLQSEYKIKLRNLEERLLKLLNDTKIDIIDDDDLLTTLESLKNESSEINNEAAKTDLLIEETNNSSEIYNDVAESCSILYRILRSASIVNASHLPTQKSFLSAVEWSLGRLSIDVNGSNLQERLKSIKREISKNVFLRAARYLHRDDSLVFGLLIFCMILKDKNIDGVDLINLMLNVSDKNKNTFLLDFLKFGSYRQFKTSDCVSSWNSDVALMFVEYLTGISRLDDDISNKISIHPSPVEKLAEIDSNLIGDFSRKTIDPRSLLAFFRICLITLLRIENFIPAAIIFLKEVLSHGVDQDLSQKILANCEEMDSSGLILVLFSGEHDDPGSKIEAIAEEYGKKMSSFSLGSAEACKIAECAIAEAALNGDWMLLKGAHFSLEWVINLDLFLNELPIATDFRLLVTMRADALTNDVHLSEKFSTIVEEPKTGLRVNLIECMHRVKNLFPHYQRNELRMCFMFSWIHCVICGRLRYVPIGWTKAYEINMLDFDSGLKIVDGWIKSTGSDYDSYNFDSIINNISDAVYKLTIDTEQDVDILMILIKRYMHGGIFSEIVLCESVGGYPELRLPYFDFFEDYFKWINDFLEYQTPTWLNLPYDAEKFRMEESGRYVISKMSTTLDGVTRIDINSEKLTGTDTINNQKLLTLASGSSPAPMAQDLITRLMVFTSTWKLDTETKFTSDPVRIYFIKEFGTMCDVLRVARKEIEMLSFPAENRSILQENLLSLLSNNITPHTWRLPLKCYDTTALDKWMKAVSVIFENMSLKDSRVIDILELANPKGLVDAVIQQKCQGLGCTLEEVVLVNDSSVKEDILLTLSGFSLEGGAYMESDIIHSRPIIPHQKVTLFLQLKSLLPRFIRDYVSIPAYDSKSRSEVLFNIYVKLNSNAEFEAEALRFYGACFVPDNER